MQNQNGHAPSPDLSLAMHHKFNSLEKAEPRLLIPVISLSTLREVDRGTEEVVAKQRNVHGNVAILLRLVEESYSKKAWHGPNLRGSLRGVTLEQASWRPGPHRHNIWEIVVHCAYWKYIARRRMLNERTGSFPLRGSNWFKRPMVYTSKALSHDIALLEATHTKLIGAIKILEPRKLSQIPRNGSTSAETLVRGIASHDVYHAGQIQLLKKLMQ